MLRRGKDREQLAATWHFDTKRAPERQLYLVLVLVFYAHSVNIVVRNFGPPS